MNEPRTACGHTFGYMPACPQCKVERGEAVKWATRECKGHSKPLLLPGCLHCAEDEKVLEERIAAVAATIAPDVQSSLGLQTIRDRSDQREAIRAALRSLVREVRRG